MMFYWNLGNLWKQKTGTLSDLAASYNPHSKQFSFNSSLFETNEERDLLGKICDSVAEYKQRKLSLKETWNFNQQDNRLPDQYRWREFTYGRVSLVYTNLLAEEYCLTSDPDGTLERPKIDTLVFIEAVNRWFNINNRLMSLKEIVEAIEL